MRNTLLRLSMNYVRVRLGGLYGLDGNDFGVNLNSYEIYVE
jgi:hypothetical protein